MIMIMTTHCFDLNKAQIFFKSHPTKPKMDHQILDLHVCPMSFQILVHINYSGHNIQSDVQFKLEIWFGDSIKIQIIHQP